MLSHSISCPYLIEFHDFPHNIQQAMEHQMAGATEAQQGMTFKTTLIFTFYFLSLEPDISQNVRTGPVFRLDAR
jgi:hypothetical protein